MAIKTGKTCFISLLILSVLSVSNILSAGSVSALKLDVLSPEGIPVKRVMTDCRFVIKVSVPITTQQTADPVLENKEQLEILSQSRSYNVTIHNGVQQATGDFVYQVKARTSGMLCLRATVGTEQSNTHELHVTSGNKAENNSSTSTGGLTGELTLEKTQAFVGEKLSCVVRFRADKNYTVQIYQVTAFPDNLQLSKFEGPTCCLERMGTTDISVLEWHGAITALQPGSYILPSLVLECRKQARRKHLFFSLFAQVKSKRLQTEPVELLVRALPAHPGGKQVHCIGKIRNFVSKLEKTALVQGQATHFTLILDTSGSLDIPQAPSLSIPTALTCYAPRVVTEQQATGMRIIWEYVLQARTPGDIALPAQEFTWFDPDIQKFASAQTEAYSITVTPASEQGEINQESQESTGNTADCKTDLTGVQQNAPEDELSTRIITVIQVPRKRLSIVWQHFFVLMLMPVGLWGMSSMLFYAASRRRAWWRAFSYYTAYYRARMALAQARKTGQAYTLYILFRQLVIDRLQLDTVQNSIHDEEVLYACLHARFDEQVYTQWSNFVQQIMQCSAYAPQSTAHAVSTDIFDAAQRWIEFLRTCL